MTDDALLALFSKPLNTNAVTYTSAAPPCQALTLEALERAVALVEALPPEPIGEWMRAQGCPPECWTVIFPESLRDEGGPCIWPSYVRFSSAAKAAVFVPTRSLPTLKDLP